MLIAKITVLRRQVKQWRQAGESIAFVPTMGNLHAGHLQLVKAAKAQADHVIVSIFVNPTQFGQGEDFASYPKTLDVDTEQLAALSVDIVFTPSVEEMYPNVGLTTVSVEKITENYCGMARPGHFDGVATVVNKLFNIVQPDSAFFGEKDFQQLAVIRTMVADLNSPVEIFSVPTFREESGLAMSSRNGYLGETEKNLAAELYQSLCAAQQAVLAKQPAYAEIEAAQTQKLMHLGFCVEYFTVCRRGDLQSAGMNDKHIIILVAARLGKTRLIDNIQIDL
ncbi:MAG: pantoate--beta-alanine ligase [Methyloprofundus sp.]|nr:pantoate--beta-alanine ligase [Methyloprofundus sp.]